MLTYRKIAAAVLCLLFVNVSASAEAYKWHPPKAGVIRDAKTAISVARLLWFSINPDIKPHSDKEWQSIKIATLHNGIWRVDDLPLGPGMIGGTLEIDIAKSDARLVGVYLTQ